MEASEKPAPKGDSASEKQLNFIRSLQKRMDLDDDGLEEIKTIFREAEVKVLRRKLKVGGVLYISYNTLPGWAPMLPMRHLMTQYVKSAGASGTVFGARGATPAR